MRPSTDPTTNAALADKYDAVAYDARPIPLTHPAHLAAVAAMFNATPASVATCRVLELGSNDGANLIPLAATLPEATFVGCDLAPRSVEAGNRMIADLGLTNVSLLLQDLRTLPDALGSFDYVIAHGVYSWVPAAVRDALFELAARRLAPNGVMYVSYNTYPGCRVRQAAWDILRYHTADAPDARARLEGARNIASLLADDGDTEVPVDAFLRAEFRELVGRTDSLLFHDDLGAPNDPVYFHEFVAHARRYGLAFVAEAQPWMMSTSGLAPRMRQFVAGLDPLRREQYLDFARFRRIRHSLLCRGSPDSRFTLTPPRVSGMHVGAPSALARAANDGRLPAAAGAEAPELALLRMLVEAWPRTVSFDDAANFLRARHTVARPIEALLAERWMAGEIELVSQPRPIATTAGDGPVASPVARWQATRRELLTTLRHEGVRLPDPVARELLTLLDGSRDRTALATVVAPRMPGRTVAEARAFVDDYLRQFARQALLVAPA